MKLMSQEKIAEYKQPDEPGRKHTHDTKYHRGKELCWKQIDHQVGCRIQQPQIIAECQLVEGSPKCIKINIRPASIAKNTAANIAVFI